MVGQEVTFSYAVKNYGGESITIDTIMPQGHAYDDGQQTGLWNVPSHNITVGPGETVNINAHRSFEWEATWCIEHIPVLDQNGAWFDLPANGYRQTQCFEVGSPAAEDGITLCENEDFGGWREVLTGDDGNLEEPYDDAVTSIMVRGPYIATVYQDPNYGGTAEVFNHDDRDLHDNPVGNDSITSLRVYPAVALYEHANFDGEGKCETFVGDVSDLNGTYIGDNKISSIKVPSEYIAVLYEDSNYGGQGEVFASDDSNLTDNPIGNDTVSSIKLERVVPDGITLFEHENFIGRHGTFTSDDGNLVEPYDDMATSIKVRGPYMVTVYKDPNYGGTAETFDHDDPDLGGNSIGSDTITSLRIWPAAALCEHPNYRGRCQAFDEDEADLSGTHIGRDAASSLKVPADYLVTLCEDPSFGGTCQTFTGDVPDLISTDVGDNAVSSIMVSSPTSDTTPPETNITSGPQGDIPVGDACFSWTGSDDVTPTGDLVYSYRLRGASDVWSAWDGDTNHCYSDLSDGGYTFEVRARDLADNADGTPASRSFGVDVTPPETTITSGPSGCIGTADVTFTWAGSDNRTPTADLLYSYKLEGPGDDWSAWTSDTSRSYTDLSDGDYTFEVKAKDELGHEDPSPAARSFRVDTTPPTGSVLVNGGDSTTNKITVHLDITGDDGPVGCGVTEMRLSNDGFNWEAWESFATEGEWLLPTLNRTTWTVHLQLKDLVGNVSEAFTDDIYLDLYPPRPSSESYQLGARVVASADPTSISESYGLLSATMGQPIADGRLQSADYHLESGYQGAWPSVPRGRPPAESYDTKANLVASSGEYQASESYRLQSAMGQSTNVGPRSSENYQLLSGYLPCKLLGDLNVNGQVNVADIMMAANKWHCQRGDDRYDERCDLDKDGDIDIVDIMLVVAHWGETCG
jgi:hypothetical protein